MGFKARGQNIRAAVSATMIERALAKYRTGAAAAASLGLTWTTFWRRAQELGIAVKPAVEVNKLREALNEHADVKIVAQKLGLTEAEVLAAIRRYHIHPSRNAFRGAWNRTGGDLEQLVNRFGLTIAECRRLARTYRVGPDEDAIRKALGESSSIMEAARRLGVPRTTFERRLDELGIPNPFRKS